MIDNDVSKKAADTLLEAAQAVKIGRRTYKVKPITLGQIIRISAMADALPVFDTNLEASKRAREIVRTAKDCRKMAEIIAIAVIPEAAFSDNLLTRLRCRIVANQALALNPSDMFALLDTLFNPAEMAAFFGCGAFLHATSITTTEAPRTQAPGQ